ncbi:MAG: hypothetical protein J7M21_06385 [Planctomycetes bacterium]|nr:hypothetical protein [Planctomycetota bacterium]
MPFGSFLAISQGFWRTERLAAGVCFAGAAQTEADAAASITIEAAIVFMAALQDEVAPDILARPAGRLQ